MFCRATYRISKEFIFIVDFFNEEKLLAAAGGTILYYRFIEKKREKTSPFSIYFNLLGYLTSEVGKLRKQSLSFTSFKQLVFCFEKVLMLFSPIEKKN